MQQIKEQPYERFLSSGPGSLTNAELLGIILRTGTKGVSAVELGRRVLGLHDPQCESLSALPGISMEELRALPGIGEVKAVKLLCLSEIARRIRTGNPLSHAACAMDAPSISAQSPWN